MVEPLVTCFMVRYRNIMTPVYVVNHIVTYIKVPFINGSRAIRTPKTFVFFLFQTETPEQGSPIINGTVIKNGELPYREIPSNAALICEIRNSRPLIPLAWSTRNTNGELDITHNNGSSNNSSFYSYSVELKNLFPGDSLLQLFVCKADDSLELLERNESNIMVLKENIDLLHKDAVLEFSIIGSEVTFTCSENEVDLVVWKKMTTNGDFYDLLYAALDEGFKRVYFEEVTEDGSLIIPSVDFHSEGLYACIYKGENVDDGTKLYNLTVIGKMSSAEVLMSHQIENCIHTIHFERKRCNYSPY